MYKKWNYFKLTLITFVTLQPQKLCDPFFFFCVTTRSLENLFTQRRVHPFPEFFRVSFPSTTFAVISG